MRYLGFILLLCSTLTFAAEDLLTFRDTAQQQQYQHLTQELRCPKCQNSSIADSGSVIAADMRQKVYQLLQEGKSEQQVIDYMVARYGHFVTYEPPLTPLTWLLWGAPLAIVLLGGFIVWRRTRQTVELTEPDSVLSPSQSSVIPHWQWIAGVVVACGASVVLMAKTGDYQQVREWQTTVAQTDTLLQQYHDDPQTAQDKAFLTRLALGLRTRLADAPDDINNWMQLGRVGLQLDDASLAIQAFDKAHALDPDNATATIGLADVLTRSNDAQDNQRGGNLLKGLILKGNTTLPVINLLAVNAQQQQHYAEALMAWNLVLKLLPPDDAHRAQIVANIEQLKAKASN